MIFIWYNKIMLEKYKVITLCGSARFKDDFIKVQKRLSIEGNIALSLSFFDLDKGEVLTDENKKLLDDIHKRKIDMSDEIYVINKGGYIWESTRSEIEYAKKKNKIVNYMEN